MRIEKIGCIVIIIILVLAAGFLMHASIEDTRIRAEYWRHPIVLDSSDNEAVVFAKPLYGYDNYEFWPLPFTESRRWFTKVGSNDDTIEFWFQERLWNGTLWSYHIHGPFIMGDSDNLRNMTIQLNNNTVWVTV